MRLEHFLQLARELARVAVTYREQGVRLAGQNVDVKRPDQADQGLPYCGIAVNHQCVAARIGGYLAAFGNIGFEYLGEVFGRGITQRHHLDARADRVCSGDLVPRVACGDRHDGVHSVPFDQRCAVCVEQGFERRQQCGARQRRSCIDRAGTVHVGVDRVAELKSGAEDRAGDLANVGVDEVERDIAGFAPGARSWRQWDRRFRRHAARREGALSAAVARNCTAHPRRRCLQGSWFFQRLQIRRRWDVLARGKRYRRYREHEQTSHG